VVEELARNGASTIIADLQLDKAPEATRLQQQGYKVEAAHLDVIDSTAVNTFFENLAADRGRLDILVNNAGVGQKVGPIVEMPDQEWKRVMDVTLTGAFYCCRAGGRIMEDQEAGCIVNISSINGQSPAALVAAYNVAKAGVISLTQTLALELAGKTLGVIGLGRVGARLSQTAALGINMTVHGYDPFVDRASYSGPVIIEDSLETLIPIADFLSIHVPLTPQTQHLINEGILKLCKSNCIIVNTSRGGVIDEVALAKALHEGTLAGAALDVFEEEPPLLDHPLCRAPNTLLTPHIAGLTQQSQENMSLQVARGVLDVLHGRPPEHTISM